MRVPVPLRDGRPSGIASYIVWGSDTDVGKSLVCAAIAHAARKLGVPFAYCKPVQTGIGHAMAADPWWDMDGSKVARAARAQHELGPHAALALARAEKGRDGDDGWHARTPWPAFGGKNGGHEGGPRRVTTLFGWGAAVSPHLAVELEGRAVADEMVLSALRAFQERFRAEHAAGLMLVEIAGGPLSPGPSATPFADLLRPTRFPGLLVGSPHLGGITGTLCAKESVEIRGFEVTDVVLLEGEAEQRLEGAEAEVEGTKSNLNNASALRAILSGPRDPKVRSFQALCGQAAVQDSDAYLGELDNWLEAVSGDMEVRSDALCYSHSPLSFPQF